MHSMTQCPACLTSRSTTSLQYKNTEFPGHHCFEGLVITVCRDCGFGWVDKNVDDEQLSDFYKSFYRSSASPYCLDYDKLDPGWVGARAIGQICLASAFLEQKSGPITFIDFGPGGGDSFAAVKRCFPGAKCYAIELDSDAASYYKHRAGVDDVFSTLSEAGEAGISADLLLMSHSLEHIHCKVVTKVLSAAWDLLRIGGLLIIECPRVNLLEHDTQTDAPHLLFFNERNIKGFLDQRLWTVLLSRSTGPYYQSTGNEVPPHDQLDNILYGGNRTCFRVVLQKDSKDHILLL